LGNCRVKEQLAEIKAALWRAALAYRLRGQTGLESVRDPAGNGPFSMRSVTHDGKPCGFALTSAYQARGYPETLVLVELPGLALHVDGEHAGEPLGNVESSR
jgi:hypothetical protein